MHTMRLQVIRPVISGILDSVEAHASEELALRLYPLKVAIGKFIERLRPLVVCLRGLLHAEVEYSSLNEPSFGDAFSDLQPPSKDGSPTDIVVSIPGSRARRRGSNSYPTTADTQSFEEIVATWANNAQEVLADAMEVSANIEDAAQFVETFLSFLRTKLLRMELVATVVSLVMGFASLVFGMFGMSLKSGLEERDGWFLAVIMFVFIVSVVGFVLLFVLYLRDKRHYRAKCALYANNRFFHNIEDDEYILQAVGGGVGQSLHDLRTPVAPFHRSNSSLLDTPKSTAGTKTF